MISCSDNITISRNCKKVCGLYCVAASSGFGIICSLQLFELSWKLWRDDIAATIPDRLESLKWPQYPPNLITMKLRKMAQEQKCGGQRTAFSKQYSCQLSCLDFQISTCSTASSAVYLCQAHQQNELWVNWKLLRIVQEHLCLMILWHHCLFWQLRRSWWWYCQMRTLLFV